MTNSKTVSALLATVAALAATPPAWAEAADAATEVAQVTVIATRSEKDVDEVPATVSVIDSRDIADGLMTDIKDLVRDEPGVSVRTSPARFSAALAATGRDGASGFNIRGLEGNRVLITVDGVRVPDAFSFGAQSVGRGDYVDLDLLKSVEILRGPASALYGSDGVAGAVSFVTKDPADFLRGGGRFGGQAKLSYGSADASLAEGLVLAGRSGPVSGMIAYTRRDGGELENRGDNNAADLTRTTANPQDIQSNAVLAKLVFDPDDGGRLGLTYEYFDRDARTQVLSARAIPPLSSTSVLNLDALDTIRRRRAGIDYRRSWGEGLLRDITLAAAYQDSETVQFSAEDRNTAADRTRRNSFDNRVLSLSGVVSGEVQAGGIVHRLTGGADGSVTRQAGLRDGTVPPTGETFPTRTFPTTDYSLAGVFLQDEVSIGGLTLYPALRLDYYRIDPQTDALVVGLVPAGQSGSRLSPKLAATYDLTDQVSLFANYAQGFKAPAPSQVNNAFANLAFNYRSIPNPDLKPETSQTFEAGVRWRGERWFVGASAFTGRYDDFIDQARVGGTFTTLDPALYQYVNLAKVRIGGVELKARADLGGGFTGSFGAAYSRGDSETAGVRTPLASIDPVKVVAGLAWRSPDGRHGGSLNVTHSAGKDEDRVGVTCAPSCFTPKAFTVIDATGWWAVTERAVLRVGVFNLTDEKYWWWGDVRGVASTSTAVDAYTQPGRDAGASLTLRF